jgi:hypothetical protein
MSSNNFVAGIVEVQIHEHDLSREVLTFTRETGSINGRGLAATLSEP